MQAKANISTVLKRSLNKSVFNQKSLSGETKIPGASVSDHFNGSPVRFERAVKYVEAFEEVGERSTVNDLTSNMSYEYLGFIKAMDGPLAEICTTAELDIFQKMESEERKERKNRAEVLIVQSKIRNLENFEYDELKQYALEFLDEIIVELAIVFSILKIIGMSIQEAIQIKMPEWVAKKYMKG